MSADDTDDIDPIELYLVDAILDVLSGADESDDYSADALLAMLIAWRNDVDSEPIELMENPPTAA